MLLALRLSRKFQTGSSGPRLRQLVRKSMVSESRPGVERTRELLRRMLRDERVDVERKRRRGREVGSEIAISNIYRFTLEYIQRAEWFGLFVCFSRMLAPELDWNYHGLWANPRRGILSPKIWSNAGRCERRKRAFRALVFNVKRGLIGFRGKREKERARDSGKHVAGDNRIPRQVDLS